MSTLPEPDQLNPDDSGAPAETHSPESPTIHATQPEIENDPAAIESAPPVEWSAPPANPTHVLAEPVNASAQIPASVPASAGQPLFQSYTNPPPRPPVRVPHFGHLLLLAALTLVGLLVTGLVMGVAIHKHLFGATSAQQAISKIQYILGSEAILYLATFGAALVVFPLFWHKNLLAGLQWNGATALRLRRRLVSAAFVCFLLAVVGGEFMHNPTNTPIEEVFRTPGAAWFLFVFGVTFAPFFEETLFRGFLLPSLCTAYDWFAEKTTGEPVRPLGPNGHPQWSFSAMAVGSIATSIPFAWMHAQQTGYSLGPFLLLVCVSLVLCIVRLSTRSLASSVLVHASYNFLLFSLMLIGTGGFRHLDKM